MLSEDYGAIYVNIGKPISVHNLCQECGISRIHHSLIPKSVSFCLLVFVLLETTVTKLIHIIVLLYKNKRALTEPAH